MPTNRSHPASRTIRTITLAGRVLGALAAGTLAGACASEGGPGYSADGYTYVSTPWQPKTVTLRDTRTGQEFWSVDVPVGKQLTIQFSEQDVSPPAKPDPYTPDLLRWAIVEEGEKFPRLSNELAVPNKHARRLDVTLRATPEMPDGMLPAQRRAQKKMDAAGAP